MWEVKVSSKVIFTFIHVVIFISFITYAIFCGLLGSSFAAGKGHFPLEASVTPHLTAPLEAAVARGEQFRNIPVHTQVTVTTERLAGPLLSCSDSVRPLS